MKAAPGISLALALASLAGACASPPQAPAAARPPAHAEPARPAPPPQTPDTCGLEAGRGLIGRSRLEIPVPVRPENQRVACTTCSVTQDYNPARITYSYDLETGRVTDVRCG